MRIFGFAECCVCKLSIYTAVKNKKIKKLYYYYFYYFTMLY